MKKGLAIAVAALMLFVAVDAQAGDKQRRGTAGSTHLLVPLTARTAALGTAVTSGVAGMSGLEGLDANAANLTLNQGTNVLVSRMDYVADIGVNYFGVAQRFGSNNIALTLSSWDFGDIPLQTETSPDVSNVTWSANYTTLGLAYARNLTDRISAGINVKIVNERIDDVDASGVAFDAGMTYEAGDSGFRFGVSLKNFGPERRYSGTGLVRFVKLPGQIDAAQPSAVSIEGAPYDMPSLLNFGAAYTIDTGAGAAVTLLGNFRSNSFTQDQYSAAVVVTLMDMLYVRGGYMMEQDMDLTFYNGTNFGAGVALDLSGVQVNVDYALRQTEFFDNVSMLTASFTL